MSGKEVRFRRRRRSLAALVAVLAVVLPGCGDDSPVTPGREPLVFEGRIATGGFDSYALPLARGGTVRIEVEKLTPVFIEITNLPADTELSEVLSIGVGIGEFDDEGVCDPELRPNLMEGRSVTVLLSDGVNCIAIFDSGRLPQDTLLDYRVVVTDAARSS